MILVDDTEKSVVEPLEAHKGEMKKLYDFDLMKRVVISQAILLKSLCRKDNRRT
jgi:hypothetical protein